MQIVVDKSLKEIGGEVSREFRPTPDELQYDDVVFSKKPIRVEVDLQNTGDRLIGTIRVDCEIVLECARCVESTMLAVSAERQAQFVQNPTPEILDSEREGWFVSRYDGETVELDDDVRQMLMLMVPIQTLCREDCKGICAQCGANLNDRVCGCPPPPPPSPGDSPFRAAFDEWNRKKKK
jgi:uncharacterized metal-binding protein YceD (DUF177 family)